MSLSVSENTASQNDTAETLATALSKMLGVVEADKQQDINAFIQQAHSDMNAIMASYNDDAKLMHSSALLAAAHACDAEVYTTKLAEEIAEALELSQNIRQTVYGAIEQNYMAQRESALV